MKCAVSSCDRPAIAKGFCKPHWHRNNRYGDPTAGMYREGQGPEWLRAHVSHDGDECLIWPFGRNSRGYGAVGFRGKRVGAHRAMCILAHGEPPTGTSHAAHSCGNGHLGCVNPNHLAWKSPAENQRDRLRHGTDVRGEKNSCAAITKEDVRVIRRRAAAGETQTAIAADFGITNYAVWSIVHRRTWAWLDRKEEVQ